VGWSDVGCIFTSPEQHRTPVEHSVAPKEWPRCVNQMLHKSTFARSVWAHDSDKKARGLKPSLNAPYRIGEHVRYQSHWISQKACLPSLIFHLRKQLVHSPAGKSVNNLLAYVSDEELAGEPLRCGSAQVLD